VSAGVKGDLSSFTPFFFVYNFDFGIRWYRRMAPGVFMSNPELLPQPLPDDHWSEDELRQLFEENHNTQMVILGPLLQNPDLFQQAYDYNLIFEYAFHAGALAEAALKEELRKHPERRVWNRLEHFTLRKLPQVFDRNPHMKHAYGETVEDVMFSYHQAIEQAQLNKSIYEQEVGLFQDGEALLTEHRPSEEEAFTGLRSEFASTYQDQYKRLRRMITKYDLKNSTPFFVLEDEVKRLDPGVQLQFRENANTLMELRYKYQALLSWKNKVHFEVVTSDLTREYVSALIGEFGRLPEDVAPVELLYARMQEMMSKDPAYTVLTSSNTVRHKQAIPTNLPGNLAFHLTYTDMGDETASKFLVQLSATQQHLG